MGNFYYRRAVGFLQTLYLISLPFSTKMYIAIHILPLKKSQEMRSEILPVYRHYHYKYIFQGKDHIR